MPNLLYEYSIVTAAKYHLHRKVGLMSSDIQLIGMSTSGQNKPLTALDKCIAFYN